MSARPGADSGQGAGKWVEPRENPVPLGWGSVRMRRDQPAWEERLMADENIGEGAFTAPITDMSEDTGTVLITAPTARSRTAGG